ncbi:MAG: hypothetical protein E6K81_06000 [Candidatus Eisenbacteria bacterium]|uniref:Uncharacterized protein n=1 Tax=Eiseniibacteriota bacterium TaxID=2212470 RepID=A0A538UB86_UNCEI|nr:MAG: hypothetical protein E6K81_06000 [Candidatus Eisenbacteria bacterium]
MTRTNHRALYVLCVSNRGFRASLIVRKVYRTIPDLKAEARSLVRVIDESGEGYLYPERLFVAIELPREAGRAFRAAS